MRKIKEILRLHREQKLSQRHISRGAGVSQSTVHEYITRAQAAGLTWPLPEDWDEERIEAALYPVSATAATTTPEAAAVYRRPQPDFKHVQQQLGAHRELTLELLWEEYREQNSVGGYSYSRFCKLYRRWKKKHDVVLRQDHRPGENSSSIGPAPPFRSTMPTGALHARRCSSARLGSQATPTPRPRRISRWSIGSKYR